MCVAEILTGLARECYYLLQGRTWTFICLRPTVPVSRLLTTALCLTATVGAQQQIPNVADLLKDVRAHQQKLDDIRENYTFHQIVTTDELDPNGAVKKNTSQEREIFFVYGYRIGRLVKRNGVPLAPGR